MTEDNSKSLDLLGAKPVASAIEHASKTTVDGASNFLGRICMPAAEEFGLLLQDKVRSWRANNTAKVLQAAEEKVNRLRAGQVVRIHPRLLAVTLEQGGWTDNETLQQMWAGLLASACTATGRDESNLIFTSFLARMTSAQARLLNYMCEQAKKLCDVNGLVLAEVELKVTLETLMRVAEIADLHQLDMELDSLKSEGLMEPTAGLRSDTPRSEPIDVTPTALALNLYVRAQGYVGHPAAYFGLAVPADC